MEVSKLTGSLQPQSWRGAEYTFIESVYYYVCVTIWHYNDDSPDIMEDVYFYVHCNFLAAFCSALLDCQPDMRQRYQLEIVGVSRLCHDIPVISVPDER